MLIRPQQHRWLGELRDLWLRVQERASSTPTAVTGRARRASDLFCIYIDVNQEQTHAHKCLSLPIIIIIISSSSSSVELWRVQLHTSFIIFAAYTHLTISLSSSSFVFTLKYTVSQKVGSPIHSCNFVEILTLYSKFFTAGKIVKFPIKRNISLHTFSIVHRS